MMKFWSKLKVFGESQAGVNHTQKIHYVEISHVFYEDKLDLYWIYTKLDLY